MRWAIFLVVGEGSDESCIDFARLLYRGEDRQDLAREYFDVYFPRDEALHRRRTLPDGRLVHASELYTEEQLKTSVAYNEGWRRMGGQNGLTVHFDEPDGLRIVWVLGNPAAADGWQSGQVRLVERLLPHIRQFVGLRQALAAADALGSGLAGLLDNDRIGVVQLDRSGRMLEVNAPALEILRRGDGLLDRDGVLDARLPADRSRLRRLLGRALPGLWGEVSGGGSMTVQRPSGAGATGAACQPGGRSRGGFRRPPGGGAGAGGRPGAPSAHRRAAGGDDARPDGVGGANGGAAGRGPEGARDRRRHGLERELRALADSAGVPQAGRVGTGRSGAASPRGGRPAASLRARRQPTPPSLPRPPSALPRAFGYLQNCRIYRLPGSLRLARNAVAVGGPAGVVPCPTRRAMAVVVMRRGARSLGSFLPGNAELGRVAMDPGSAERRAHCACIDAGDRWPGEGVCVGSTRPLRAARARGEAMAFAVSARRFLRSTRAGAAAVTAAVVTVMAVGGAALITDHVWLVDQRDTLKSAADSASIAATIAMNRILEADPTVTDPVLKDDLEGIARRYIELNLSHLAAARLAPREGDARRRAYHRPRSEPGRSSGRSRSGRDARCARSAAAGQLRRARRPAGRHRRRVRGDSRSRWCWPWT